MASGCAEQPLGSALDLSDSSVLEGLVSLMCDGSVKDSPAHELERCARVGDARNIQLLLERHPELKEKSRIQSLPSIIWASLYGWVELVDTLLNLGCRTDVLDARGRNALYAACALGRLGVCHRLLQAGIDSRHADPRGATAVMVAAHRGHVELVRAVVQSDPAQVRLADHRGWTPLFHAVCSGAEDVMLLLIECGADVGHVDAQGWTALRHAKELQRHSCGQILQRAQAAQTRETQRRRLLLRFRALAQSPPRPPTPQYLPTCPGCLSSLVPRLLRRQTHKAVDSWSRPPALQSCSHTADPTVEKSDDHLLAGLSPSSTTLCSDDSSVGPPSPVAVKAGPVGHWSQLLARQRHPSSARRLSIRAAKGQGHKQGGEGRERLAGVAWDVVEHMNADMFNELMAYMGP